MHVKPLYVSVPSKYFGYKLLKPIMLT